LKDKLSMTPWHDDPFIEESPTLRNLLIKINQSGLVTYDSQPGLVMKKGIYRAYMNGIIEKKYLRNFIEFLIMIILIFQPMVRFASTISLNPSMDKLYSVLSLNFFHIFTKLNCVCG